MKEGNRPEWSRVTGAGIFRVPTEGGKFDRHYHDCDEYWLIFKGKAKILPFGPLAYCKDSIAGLEAADVGVVHHFADGDAIAQHVCGAAQDKFRPIEPVVTDMSHREKDDPAVCLAREIGEDEGPRVDLEAAPIGQKIHVVDRILENRSQARARVADLRAGDHRQRPQTGFDDSVVILQFSDAMVKIQLDSYVDKAIFQNHGGLIPTTAGETVADTNPNISPVSAERL